MLKQQNGKLIVEIENGSGQSPDTFEVEFDWEVIPPDDSVGYRGQIDIGDNWTILGENELSYLKDYVRDWVKDNQSTLEELVCEELADKQAQAEQDYWDAKRGK